MGFEEFLCKLRVVKGSLWMALEESLDMHHCITAFFSRLIGARFYRWFFPHTFIISPKKFRGAICETPRNIGTCLFCIEFSTYYAHAAIVFPQILRIIFTTKNHPRLRGGSLIIPIGIIFSLK